MGFFRAFLALKVILTKSLTNGHKADIVLKS